MYTSSEQGSSSFRRILFLFVILVYTSLSLHSSHSSSSHIKDAALKRESAGEKDSAVSLEAWINATEPYYPQEKKEMPSPAIFKHIPLLELGWLKRYAEEHDIKLDECEMSYYDYANDSPMTGLVPLRG
ncbi:hypothetical protein B0H66DRAFT_538281 [Apodospora peruviana]|uniref:Uncharacterized protein n=1 Tax=Apodospora peruviana TaxID=516989 RepID=A0AAE0HUL9_9PEZI|nr:hypothetical protein B0H66DRAFT_538281 [Apodospora peruviana]